MAMWRRAGSLGDVWAYRRFGVDMEWLFGELAFRVDLPCSSIRREVTRSRF